MNYMRYDNDIKKIKFDVLKKVAQYSYSGTLEKNIDNIPYEIIHSKKPKYRCCIYKEREIIRERTLLATGKSLHTNTQDEIITVIPSACEGCPINRYTVTTNCQRCLAKKCVNACPFGAISVNASGAYIDQDKCRECGKCAAACPYNAIADTLRPCIRSCPVNAISMDSDKQATIKYDSCINCGACTVSCPFGAISDSSSIVDVINMIKSNKRVIAIFAPSIEGQFGKANIGMLKAAIKKLGFDDVLEVALGADAVAKNEASELMENIKNNKKMTTSCCPAFVSMIKKHFKELEGNISHTVSPMAATARYIKGKDPNCIVVFIGPCIAKKHEIKVTNNSADFILTFDELEAMFDARDINPNDEAPNSQDGSIYGKNFAISGGVSNAVLEALNEDPSCDVNVHCKKCNGADECKKALMIMKAGRLTEDIIEGMACKNGCVSGPCSVSPYNEVIKNRKKTLDKADNRKIFENLSDHKFNNIEME